jgi:hypothetical protein
MKKLFSIISFLFILSVNAHIIYSQGIKKYFFIRVIDQETGRGVPLVELKTTNELCYYTDNNGIIAFYEPGLMNQKVFFHIKSHGYEYPIDGFGYHGVSLMTLSGDSAVIKIKRINIAERLYRITGEGLYNDSRLLGLPVPLKQPLMNGKVMGQDTFIETLYRGKIYWFWGDTDEPHYPLGNFATSGATSELPGKGGLDPNIGIDLTYFMDESGFNKKMCPIADPGPVWIHWLANLKDSTGTERLIASYSRIKTLGEVYEQGLAVFNDSEEVFKPFQEFNIQNPFFPDGQSFRAVVNGQEYIYFDFSTRYPMRVKADLNHIRNLESYEAFTCLEKGTRYDTASIKIERSKNGKPVYDWKINTQPLNFDEEKFLLKKGELKSDEAWLNLCDFLTGDLIISKSGSVYWNEFRRKWVMIFEQIYGTSFVGELWYAEGDTPTGPWVYARKIVTHDNYTFYNVGQHPLFDQDKGRLIYFEGTYTNAFTDNQFPTPRYDYNQIMYRLDLNDPRLYLPSPVYIISDKKTKSRYMMRDEIDSLNHWKQIQEIPFFALPPGRKIEGSVPVYAIRQKGKIRLQSQSLDSFSEPLFYGISESILANITPDGKWNCEADGFKLEMNLQIDGNIIEGTFGEESLIINKGSFLNDTIELFIEDTTDHHSFVIKAQLSTNTINGEFKGINNNEKGVFTGKHDLSGLQQFTSPMVVPLNEFKDKDGFYFYSIKSELEGLKRSEKPVCLVWKNPSSLLNLDFEAKQVPVIK